jgi:hypothetical protein
MIVSLSIQWPMMSYGVTVAALLAFSSFFLLRCYETSSEASPVRSSRTRLHSRSSRCEANSLVVSLLSYRQPSTRKRVCLSFLTFWGFSIYILMQFFLINQLPAAS